MYYNSRNTRYHGLYTNVRERERAMIGNSEYSISECLFTNYDLTDYKNDYGKIICHKMWNEDCRSMVKTHYTIPNLEFKSSNCANKSPI